MSAPTNTDDIGVVCSRPSPFGSDSSILMMGEYAPGPANLEKLASSKILVIGAGGLGCEVLKDLALSGFRDIHVIDLDEIDVSNLNRQFLFRKKDVGRSKAHVAAEFVQRRVPGVKITPYTQPIQEHPASFYSEFKLIVAGLDNLEARRWINNVVCSLVEFDDEGQPELGSIVPLIDGGSEGFKGQARVILPHVTACFECSLDAFPPQRQFPMCTIASTPRKPEHCIAYASMVLWPKHWDRALDKDSPEDMRWVYDRALERANEYGISGVTYFLTLGVVKTIIPAIASTNALISAACVNEAYKLVTLAGQTLNSYIMYMGSQGVYTHTFPYARKEGCAVCGRPRASYHVPGSMTLQALVDKLCTDDSIVQDKFLKDPSLRAGDSTLFMASPAVLRQATEENLGKPLAELIEFGTEVAVTDETLGNSLALMVTFEE